MKLAKENPTFQKRCSKFLLALAAGAASTWMITAAATEVFTWTDENGVVHYSDAPPSQGETEKVDVPDMYRPGTTGAYESAAETAPVNAQGIEATEPDEPLSAAQQRREQIAKRSNERREAQETIDRLCDLHGTRLAQVEPARRVFYTNEAGESVRMDDDQRMSMINESKDFIDKNCE